MTAKKTTVLLGTIAVIVLAFVIVFSFAFKEEPCGEKVIDHGPEKAVRAYMEAWLGETPNFAMQLEYIPDCVIRANLLRLPVPASATRDEVVQAHKEKYGEKAYEQSLEVVFCETRRELEYYTDISYKKINQRWSMTEEEYDAIEEFAEVGFHGISTRVVEGETVTEEYTLAILCIKVDGKWYLLNTHHIDIEE